MFEFLHQSYSSSVSDNIVIANYKSGGNTTSDTTLGVYYNNGDKGFDEKVLGTLDLTLSVAGKCVLEPWGIWVAWIIFVGIIIIWLSYWDIFYYFMWGNTDMHIYIFEKWSYEMKEMWRRTDHVQ